jgi:hypothetical protein
VEFSDEDILTAVRYVAHELGETEEVTELRPGSLHPVWRAGSIVVRLELSEIASEVQTRLNNCLLLRSGGVPYVQPALPKPIPVPGEEALLATVWHYVEPVRPIDWEALGDAVAKLHRFEQQLDVGVSLTMTERLAIAVDLEPALDTGVAERFRVMLPRLEEEFAAVGWHDLPLAPAHGDLFTKNVIPAGPGRVILCDFDLFGMRPIECDLGLLHSELGNDDRWTQFVADTAARLPHPSSALHLGDGLLFSTGRSTYSNGVDTGPTTSRNCRLALGDGPVMPPLP